MPTIKEVAEACGVSKATVSQVLGSGSRPVHPRTRERVLEAARALDYRPNGVARGLARRRMNNIGLVFQHGGAPVHSNPYLMMVLDGVLAVGTRRRNSVTLCTVASWENDDWPAELSDGRCDGVLLLVPPSDCSLIGILTNRRVPFVITGECDPAATDLPSVGVDEDRAAFAITRYLRHLGHRRIAFVSLPEHRGFSFLEARREGYRLGMAADDAGALPAESTCYLSRDEALHLDLAAPDRPTALVSAYDEIALDVMAALAQRGIRIPEDISVVGFDDIPTAALARPALTTVRQPMISIGEHAAEMLLTLIERKTPEKLREILPTEIVLRASTAPPPPISSRA